MSEKEFIEQLKNENTAFPNERMARNLANSLESLSGDIFTEYIRFLFELIQNADDSGATEVAIFLQNNYIIVSHSGKPFDQKDVEAICSIGEGTKKSEENKTGYKGIGFKSVFGKSNNVSIISNGFQFRFDNTFKHSKFPKTKMPWQIIPQWTTITDLPLGVSDLIQSKAFKVSTLIQLKETTSLEKDMVELLSNGEVLLFLRSVSKISISGNLQLSIEKARNRTSATHHEISLKKNGIALSDWIVHSFEGINIEDRVRTELQNDEKTPVKLQNATVAEISFAAKIEKGKFKPLSGNESLVFTFLPTKVTAFQFPFLINSSFLTSANREEIHDDRLWNQWLMETAGKKLLDWLALLATTKEFSLQILHLLPGRNNLGNKLIDRFFSSFYTYALTKEFVPNKNSKLKKASDILIDQSGLSEETFIPSQVLIEFINQKNQKKFKNDSFVHPKLETKSKLIELKSTTFDLDNLAEFFTSGTFKSNHEPADNFSLIKYFFQKVSKTTEKDSQEWSDKLKSMPFIYAKGKKLKSPQSLCFPSINYETEFGAGITVIHSEVYPKIETDSRIKSWLEQLGVKEPSDIAYIENEIIGNIENCITKDNYLPVTRYIFNQHRKALLLDKHYEGLKGLKVFTTAKGFEAAANCYFSRAYYPNLSLESVVTDLHFLSEKYLESGDSYSAWKTFFLKLGVSENIEIEVVQSTVQISTLISRFDKEYFDFIIAWAIKEIPGEWNFGYHNNIHSVSKIKLIEKATTNLDFSRLLWKNAISNKQLGLEALTLRPSHFKWHVYRPINYTEWFIASRSCFPSSTGEILKASELFINEKEISAIAGKYLPVFECDEPLPEEWRSILPFKGKLELNDYLTILEKIAEQTEEDEIIRKYNLRRLGLIYNKLASLLSNSSKDKKQIISDWASENKLLSANGKFEKANELNWIRVDGFTTASERLKIIQLPENCETTLNSFQELISLFQVQVIDKFIPTFEKDKLDFDLKNKLQNILPYFVAIIEKRQYVDYSEEFERLIAIVAKSSFYNASEIKLSFKHKEETIEGASLNVFREHGKLYFKGRWRGPITLFNLIPELSSLLKVTGLNDELRLLLQLDEIEIIEWLTELGYDISVIKATPEYLRSRKPIKHEVPAGSLVLPATTEEVNEVAETEEDYWKTTESTAQADSFIPEVSAEDVGIGQNKPRRNKFPEQGSTEQPKYVEIADDEVRLEIGRWSERYVFNNLSKWGDYSEIVWENEFGESGKPYDFKVKESGKDKFIEVKGTPSSRKDLLYLSPNEWNLMFDQLENYILIRVYNAGKTSVFPEIRNNPREQIEQGLIQVALKL